MSKITIILITLGILYGSNIFGLVYSWLILYTDVFRKFRLQDRKYKPEVFFQRLPLILFNLGTLTLLTIVSLWFFAGIFDTSTPSAWLIIFQVVFIFVVDDAWFYFVHRLLHTNKFLLRKIHSFIWIVQVSF